jgi:hypothetical protein
VEINRPFPVGKAKNNENFEHSETSSWSTGIVIGYLYHRFTPMNQLSDAAVTMAVTLCVRCCSSNSMVCSSMQKGMATLKRPFDAVNEADCTKQQPEALFAG